MKTIGHGRLYGPVWSPDGSRIAAMTMSGVRVCSVTSAKCVRVDTSSAGKPTPVVANPFYSPPPTWAPNSRRLLFYSPGVNLVAGKQPVELPPGVKIPQADGGWWAFVKDVGGQRL